ALTDRGELLRRLAECRRCPAAGIRVESMPVFSTCERPRAILVGQAPGIRERGPRRPFAGDAGMRLRRWLEPCGLGDEQAFYGSLHLTAVAKCFPGKRAGGSDLPPSPGMLRTCLPWLRRELALVPAPLVITVGAMALAELAPGHKLDSAVGVELEAPDGRPLVALPHPSGASPWPHLPGNRERLDRALSLICARVGPG
ncbi:MAG: uracil-DNA glycosylase family protein, partial [Gaiellales bacterium]